MALRFSIITIVKNGAAEIAQTMQSVLNQEVKPWEYLILDGLSGDGTVEIVRKMEEQFAAAGIRLRVESAADHGIYDAMNKGIAKAEGDVIGILNCGDWYDPCAIREAEAALTGNAGTGAHGVSADDGQRGADLVFGNIELHRADGSIIRKKARLRRYQTSRDWNHPTMFVRARLYKENPFCCKGIHDDYAFYLKMVKKTVRIVTVDKTMAHFRMGGASNRKDFASARRRIRDRYRYCYRANGYSRFYLAECIAIEAAKMILG